MVLGKRQAERIIARLERIAETAQMRDTNFNIGGGDDDPTEFIKDTTRVWRQGWIVQPLQKIINELREIYD